MKNSAPNPEPRTPNPETLPLLLEIGCEEIPALFLTQAQQDLGERLQAALAEQRLLIPSQSGATVETYSTPRRLVAHVSTILDRQPDKSEEVIGPPVKVAIDAEGKPTRAAESFAQKNSADVNDLVRVTTPKGEYLALKKTTPGRTALEVLSDVLPGVITGIGFPKSMYWESSKVRWVRPIRWIVALLGEGASARVVPFQIAGVRSGQETYGHRLAANTEFAVSGFKDYATKLRNAYVEFDPENRRQAIESEFNVLLDDWLEAVPDPDLQDWIVDSNEWISGIRGEFDAQFLRLPREILITVMRDHQKYFAVQDDKKRLRPHFIAILGRDRDSTGTIRAGHERVLTARFSDAEFFWKADQRIPLRDRVPMLDRVTYQAKLGSYGDKVRRMEAIAREICGALREQGKMTEEEAALALRAVQLCKCDLTTQMVQEFTELQGIVGGLYARERGEPAEVADAIYDHYLPQGAEDKCPRSLIGAVVSLADKLDSVIAGFAAGLDPTGSSDPFGLRRAGNGIIRVAADLFPTIDTEALAEDATVAVLAGLPISLQFAPRDEVEKKVAEFLRSRVEFYLREIEGLRFDVVRAVTSKWSLGWEKPADAKARGAALEKVRDSEDYRSLAQAAKRTRNILVQADERKIDFRAGRENVRRELFAEKEEGELFDAHNSIWIPLGRLEREQKYDQAFRLLSTLRAPIDAFFDKVLVMTDDTERRNNRLTLLDSIMKLEFLRLADLSEISPLESETTPN